MVRSPILNPELWEELKEFLKTLPPEERGRFLEGLRAVAEILASLRGVEEARRVVRFILHPPAPNNGWAYIPDREVGMYAVYSLSWRDGKPSIGEFIKYVKGSGGQNG